MSSNVPETRVDQLAVHVLHASRAQHAPNVASAAIDNPLTPNMPEPLACERDSRLVKPQSPPSASQPPAPTLSSGLDALSLIRLAMALSLSAALARARGHQRGSNCSDSSRERTLTSRSAQSVRMHPGCGQDPGQHRPLRLDDGVGVSALTAARRNKHRSATAALLSIGFVGGDT